MNVLLIDVDSKIPNLALMKISQYHKLKGDNVGFNIRDPALIYASIIFRKNKHLLDGLKYIYPNAKIDIGGPGYDLNKKLPEEIEKLTPDYSLYPDNDRFIGFTSRGCIRNCPFCIVRKKEGAFKIQFDSPISALKTIMGNAEYDKIEFLDNNILANKKWFMDLTEEIIKRNLKVDFNQGLDIRLLDIDIAKRISELKPVNCFKFAFDNMDYKDHVLKGIDLLKNAGVCVRRHVMFYVYVENDEYYNDAVERCRILKEHGATAYIMLNLECKHTKRLKQLKRWTRPWLFWSIDINDYSRGKTHKNIGGNVEKS